MKDFKSSISSLKNKFKPIDLNDKSRQKALNYILNIISLIRLTRIKTRLLVVFVLLSSAPLLILGYSSYKKSSTAIETKIQYFSGEMFAQTSQNIRFAMNSIESSCNELKMNEDFQDLLKQYDGNKEDVGVKTSVTLELNDFLVAKFTSVLYESIVGAIFVSDGEMIGGSGVSQVMRNYYDSKYTDIAEEANGEFVWMLERAKDTGENYLVVVTQVYDNLTGRSLGTLIVVAEERLLSDVYSPVEITDSTDLFILDANGVVISSKDKSKIPINTFYSNQEVIEKINNQIKKLESEQDVEGVSRDIKGTSVAKIGKENYLISFSRIKDTNWFIVGTIPMSYLTEDSNSILTNMFKVGFAIFILAVLVSVIISFSILSPLTRLESLMKKVRGGNLNITIKDKFRDEISSLSNDFANMVETIRFLVSKVNASSNQVLKTAEEVNDLSSTYQISAEQIAESMMQIATGASEQAINSLKSVDFVNELSNDINRVEEEMKLATQIIYATKELSKSALVSVKTLNEKSMQTGKATDDIVKSINSLNGDMKEIEKIIRFIGSISDQTNLLSLNAAIEAARAGDAGRGFAVVADHIGKLAEQTNESLKTISNVIGNILKKTATAVESADNTQNIIKQQMEAVDETDNSFKEIYDSMENIGKLMVGFEASVNMIMASRQKTIDAINDISAVSEQTAATVEEVSATTQNQINDIGQLAKQAKLLKDMAQELNSSISKFEI